MTVSGSAGANNSLVSSRTPNNPSALWNPPPMGTQVGPNQGFLSAFAASCYGCNGIDYGSQYCSSFWSQS